MRTFLLVIFLTIASFGETFIKTDTEIFIDGVNAGRLYKGAEVTKNGVNFTISGWVMKGNEYILFYNNMDKIRLLKIENQYVNKYIIQETIKDSYGVSWHKVTLSFQIKTIENIADKNDDIWAPERDLYARCGSCHPAHTPEEYTVNQWPNVLKTMSERAGFTTEETNQIGSYLQYLTLNHLKGEKK